MFDKSLLGDLEIAIQMYEDITDRVLICNEESFLDWGREKKWLDVETGFDNELIDELHDQHVECWLSWKAVESNFQFSDEEIELLRVK